MYDVYGGECAGCHFQQAMAPIQALLPDELMLHILSLLPVRSLATACCACQQWRQLGAVLVGVSTCLAGWSYLMRAAGMPASTGVQLQQRPGLAQVAVTAFCSRSGGRRVSTPSLMRTWPPTFTYATCSTSTVRLLDAALCPCR